MILHLHQPLPLEGRQKVWVLVLPAPPSMMGIAETLSPDETLRLAAQLFGGLSPADLEEVEKTAFDRGHFFAG